MKRFISFMLALALFLTCCPIIELQIHAETTESGTCGNNVTWSYTDGTLTISGTGVMESYSKLYGKTFANTPWNHYNDTIQTVIIENGVTTIGRYAFYYCVNLSSVTIPNSITKIEERAFAYCSSLTEISIPESVTEIEHYTFQCCSSLNSVNIPKELTILNNHIFSECTSLTSATISDKVTKIGTGAFYKCTSLTSVRIPESVLSISNSAFYDCNSLKDVYYSGTQESWNNISIYTGSDPLKNANLICKIPIPSLGSSSVTDDSGKKYDTMDKALEGVSDGGTLTLQGNVAEDITITKDVTIDLNGNSISGAVTITEGAVLYGKDSRTDDYTVNDGEGYGKVNVISGVARSAPSYTLEAADGYIMITEEDGISFHKVSVKISSMSLRPACVGVYFTSEFAGDEVVSQYVESCGVALSVAGIPTKKNLDSCVLSSFQGFTPGITNQTGTLLSGIMKTTNSDEENNANSQMPVYGRAYICTTDGQYLFSTAVQRSLRRQVEAIDANWEKLTSIQKASFTQMFTTYQSAMENWNLPNLKTNL